MVKIGNILLMMILALVIATAVGLFKLKEFEKAEWIRVGEQLFQEETAKAKADKEISLLKNEVDSIRDEMVSRKTEAESLESELAEYKHQADSAQKRIAEVDARTASTKNRIGQVDLNIAELKTRMTNLAEDTMKLKTEFTLLRNTTDALRERLTQYIEREKQDKQVRTKALELAKAEPEEEALEKTPSQSSGPNLVGEILIVNREFDFVVVNLGENDGVKEGMVLDIYRDNNLLSQAKVETVRTSISAATLIDKGAVSKIRAGDKAFFF